MKRALFCAAIAAVLPSVAQARDDKPTQPYASVGSHGVRADGHAPIGVMGDHLHREGEWMLSYRFMRMNMAGNRIGTQSVSPETIATTIPNRFFGMPGQPPTLRIVPMNMTMDMHMFGAMYAPTNWLTLMAMTMYVRKSMDHVTFAGGAGATRLGGFTTRANGLGDTSLTALVHLFRNKVHQAHLNLGLGLPTGDYRKTGRVLAPNGARPLIRLPYAMQLGSGTWDLKPGLTYKGFWKSIGWGAQYLATVRLGRNGAGYRLGNVHSVTAWMSYQPATWVSFSMRVAADFTGRIRGRDRSIMGPVQTADPDNYGGTEVTMYFGVNLVGQEDFWRNQRIAIEFGVPVYRKLNGPQMETDWRVIVGYQIGF